MTGPDNGGHFSPSWRAGFGANESAQRMIDMVCIKAALRRSFGIIPGGPDEPDDPGLPDWSGPSTEAPYGAPPTEPRPVRDDDDEPEDEPTSGDDPPGGGEAE